MERQAPHDIQPKHARTALLVAVLMASVLFTFYTTRAASHDPEPIGPSPTATSLNGPPDDTGRADNRPHAPQAPGCSSPQWDLDSGNGVNLHCWNNVYVVSIDLRNPEVEVAPVEVNRPNSLRSVADGNTIAVINGDYTNNDCAGTRCPQGLFYAAGSDKTNYAKLCTDGLKRRVLALSSDGHPLIDWWYAFVDNPQAVCSNLVEGGGWATGYRYHIISGGPQITFDGSFRWDCAYGTAGSGDCNINGREVVINEEHFGQSATNWWNRNQTIVGYTSDGNRLLLAVTQGAVTPHGVHDVLWQVAQHHGQTLKAAIKFDGGSKSGLYYRRNPTYSINPDIPVANAWVVRRRTSPPPTATPSPSCNPGANEIALFVDANYGGQCVVKGIGDYANPGAIGLPNDSISSLKVGSNVEAFLCRDDNYGGGCETFSSNDTNLSDNSIGNDSVSSAKVEAKCDLTSIPSGYHYCADEGDFCSFSGAANVVYGAESCYTPPRTFTDGTICTNDVFGDPVPGVHKKCYTDGSTPTPTATPTPTPQTVFCPGVISGWTGEYWSNEALAGTPTLCRDDATIDFEWAEGAPDPLLPANHFSARWTRTIAFQDGAYRFNVFHDDGARLYIDGVLVLDDWCDDCRLWETVTPSLKAGKHTLRLEMRENVGWAAAQLSWQTVSSPASSSLYLPTVIR